MYVETQLFKIQLQQMVGSEQTTPCHTFPSRNSEFYIQHKRWLLTARFRSACSVRVLIKINAGRRHICTSQYSVQVEDKSMQTTKKPNTTCEWIKIWSTAGTRRRHAAAAFNQPPNLLTSRQDGAAFVSFQDHAPWNRFQAPTSTGNKPLSIYQTVTVETLKPV